MTDPSPKLSVAPALQWSEVNFKRGKKHILKDLEGEIRPGRFTAILGPSGAGKSSLLNLLAGRVKVGVLGEISLGGKVINPVQYKSQFAYVMQDDALYATSTPREAITFSAKLRGMSAAEATKRCNQLLKTLNIENSADTLIGSKMIKGVSGGERKRAAIGVDLVHNPEVLFLDEPTSGLDSHTAYSVVGEIRSIAESGRTCVATIHQPSSETFHLFHDVIFLWQGEIVYHGPVEDVVGHFASLGFPCPAEYNPADYVMFLIQTESEQTMRNIVDKWKAAPHFVRMQESVRSARANALPELPKVTTASVTTQVKELLVREAKNIPRDKGSLGARFGGSIFLGLLLGLIFDGAGDATEPTYDFRAHFGALVMVCLNAMFEPAEPVLLTFPLERPVFLREYAADMYSATAYMVSKTLIEIPLIIVHMLVAMCTWYWLIGFNASLPLMLLALVFLGLVASSYSLAIGCFAPDVKKGMEAAPLLFIPQMLFAGFFVPLENVPSYLRWAQYLCSLKYSLNLAIIAEFDDLDKMVPVPGGIGQRMLVRDIIYEQNDISTDETWMYAGILAALFVGCRVFGVWGLNRLSRTVL